MYSLEYYEQEISFQFLSVKEVYNLVRKDMDVNEHEILSNFTFRQKLK